MYGELQGALSMARETEARLTLAQARIVLLPVRIRIMRALAEKRSTVTELSRRTGASKSTVLKHLRVLAKHELVLRNEEDRLWIYYDLTRAGRAVGRLDPLRIVVLLSSIIGAALLAGAAGAWRWGLGQHGDDPWGIPPIGGEPVEPAGRAAAIALFTAGALVLAAGASVWLWSRRKLRPAQEDEPTDTSSSR